MKISSPAIVLITALMCASFCVAEDNKPTTSASTSTAAIAEIPLHTFENLNLLGSAVPQPPYRESIMGEGSAMRRSMLNHGMAFRINSLPIFSSNVLYPPASSDKQVYVGHRPFMKWGSTVQLTWDMKALHINGAQFVVSGGLEYETWTKAGPNATEFNALSIYKTLGEDRFEIKAGYFANQQEFVGTQAGGSMLTGAQGVYAVLPFEAGLSYFPLATPAFNLKWNATSHMYAKGSLQRAPDAAGGQATVNRNQAGTRFIPIHDKLVTIAEGGYKRGAASAGGWTWVRGGYVHNSTQYANFLTGGKTSGNYCGYLLGDRQFTRHAGSVNSNGLYAGASAMIVPASLNTYTQYYEVRGYDEGPFRSRPADTISLIVTHSVYSRDQIRNLALQGKTYWRNSTSITGSYTVRATRGVFISMGLGYIAGPAITPHVGNALVATVAPAIFF
jgi:porin